MLVSKVRILSIMFVMQSSQKKEGIILGFLKLLLYAGLIFINVANPVKEDITNNSGGTMDCLNNVTALHYKINLIPNTEEDNFSYYGESNISIKICIIMRTINLYSLDQDINKTATMLIDKNNVIYKPVSYNYQNETFVTVLTFDNGLSPGYYILYIKYIGGPSTEEGDYFKILYADDEGYRVWFAITPFPLIAIKQDYMCFDDPIPKPIFDISVKHDQKYKVLSNMPPREKHTNKDRTIWTHFNTTPRMSSCTITIVVLNFDRVPNADETVNVWCRSNFTSKAQFVQNVTEKVAQHMVQYTNITQIIPKTDHIVMPNFPMHGLTFWGLIIYEETAIMYGNGTHPTARKRYRAMLTAHETIHYWFGNLVSPSDWFYTWLNEGLTSLFEAYFLDKIFENWRAMDFLVIENLHSSFRTDINLTKNTLESENDDPESENESLLASTLYDKAPVILRMLQHMIHDVVFRNGIRIYLRTNQFRTVGSNNLWTAMQTALNESNIPYKDFNIKEVMDTWVKQKHYPLVTVMRNYETGETIISQEPFRLKKDEQNNIANDSKWWIPVTFTTQRNPHFNLTLPDYNWLKPNQNMSLRIDPNDWIIINLQQTGYYRVNYDATNWQKIVNYLNSEEYTKIHVLNRAQLIDDAYNLMMNKQLDICIFLNLTSYLSRETDIVAWYPMFKSLSELSQYFSLPESESFKLRMSKTFNKLLENVGYEEELNKDDLMALKRMQAINWACTLDHSDCLLKASIKLDEHLADSNKHISPYWQKWIYCFGLTGTIPKTWNKVLTLYTETHDTNLLEYLACPKEPQIIINYLNIISSNNSTIQGKEHQLAFKFIVMKNARNFVIFDYILENLERIKPKSMTIINALKDIIANVFTKMQLDKVQEFVTNNINNEASSASMQSAIEKRWVSLRYHKNNFTERFTQRSN